MADHPKSTGRESLDSIDPHTVATLIRTFAWSPIVWAGGVRRAAEFKCALWCALDFDSGTYSLSECLDEVTQAGLTHVLGTTKSHGLAKDGAPACDRFRLLLKFDHVITDRSEYERAMRAAMAVFPGSDKSCKDAARFFFPCTEIVSADEGHAFWPVEDVAVTPPREVAAAPPRPVSVPSPQPQRRQSAPRYNRLVQNFLCEGAYETGQRHERIKRIIPGLFDAGHGESETIEIILARTNKPADEVRSLVRWWREHWQEKAPR